MSEAPNPAAGWYPVAAIAMALMLAGTLLPPPLFELYRRAWHLTPAEISVVFSVYSAALIPALLFLGGISDRFGRRHTILLSFAILGAGSLILAFAADLGWLLVARVVQGVGMGTGVGAAAAAIREWLPPGQRGRAGMVTTVAASVGSAAGALLGGALGQYAPYPLALPYFVHIGCLGLAALAVFRVPHAPHAVPTTRPALIAVPRAIRRPFLIASTQAFVGWSTFAMFIALVPAFLAQALGLHNLLTGAFVVALLQAGSAAASLAGGRLPARTAIVTALVAMGAGIWLLLFAVALHAYVLIGVAAILSGGGAGLAYLAGLNVVGTLAPPDHRAETLSAYMVACYLGFSIPALGIGLAANRVGLFASFTGAAVALGLVAVAVIALATNRNLEPAPT